MKPQSHDTTKTTESTESTHRPPVIATRKTCDATGTGLSHYVLMDKDAAR
ncbi:modified peptide precursor CbpA [Magnetospirillum aberrantis]|uniref:Modified peptide CbpA n=1 Tax=Magnetospirillum aberrantis SpK TaxID=908842 RepID=A0A7C9QT46_9PROT|nr:modified peptide precursor CbpA [Magnetospirillum aberrantis]NFV79441.1 modified peptide precursor CbpA [Magnetospirillum aberrantis SpK]